MIESGFHDGPGLGTVRIMPSYLASLVLQMLVYWPPKALLSFPMVSTS